MAHSRGDTPGGDSIFDDEDGEVSGKHLPPLAHALIGGCLVTLAPSCALWCGPVPVPVPAGVPSMVGSPSSRAVSAATAATPAASLPGRHDPHLWPYT
jgi:hypothetical protein